MLFHSAIDSCLITNVSNTRPVLPLFICDETQSPDILSALICTKYSVRYKPFFGIGNLAIYLVIAPHSDKYREMTHQAKVVGSMFQISSAY